MNVSFVKCFCDDKVMFPVFPSSAHNPSDVHHKIILPLDHDSPGALAAVIISLHPIYANISITTIPRGESIHDNCIGHCECQNGSTLPAVDPMPPIHVLPLTAKGYQTNQEPRHRAAMSGSIGGTGSNGTNHPLLLSCSLPQDAIVVKRALWKAPLHNWGPK